MAKRKTKKEETVTIRFCQGCYSHSKTAGMLDMIKRNARAGKHVCVFRKEECGRVIHNG